MLPSQTVVIPSSSASDEPALPILTDRARDFITARLARGEPPERIAAALRALFQIEIDSDHLVACWQAHDTPLTQTERRPDKESVQFPADAPDESLFTRPAPDDAPDETSVTKSEAVGAGDEQTTQTGRRQNPESLQIPADTVDEPTAAYSARKDALEALGELVKTKLGIAPEPDADPAAATRTGRRQNQKNPSVLTDEVKAFIVRGLARYETPTRVAASVKANFDIEIDRRQVFAYDPAGSRRPAQRWIDLHAATRAKFMQATAEIGIAQKLVRLRMLDRFANRADEANKMALAAGFLAQAAKECGGFYERYQRPKGVAA